MTTMIVEENNPQVKQFVKFARTLPFITVKEHKQEAKSVWDTAIAEGAVTVEEFFDELDKRIKRRFWD